VTLKDAANERARFRDLDRGGSLVNGIVVALQGRLGTDPDLKYTSAGKAVCSFSVAVNDSKAGQDTPAEWVRVSCWDQLAEEMGQRLEKGAEAYIEGRLKLATWEGNDGSQRSGVNVSAWKVEPLGQIGRRGPRQDTPGRPARQVDQAAPADDSGDADWNGLGDRRQRIASAAAQGADRAATRSRWGQ
jgi:single-strand DNA-binding protein